MKKSILLAALGVSVLAAICGPALAQTCKPLTLVNTVVMSPVPGDNAMIVPVTINGTAKSLLLDTGIGFTQLSEGLVRDAHLLETNSLDNNGFKTLDTKGAVDASAARRRVSVQTFGLGRQNGTRMQFQVTADPGLGNAKPYDGFLGLDMFSLYDVDMDFGAGRLNYFASDHCAGQVVYWPKAALAIVPIALVGGKISVPATIDGHVVTAVIDTGASRTTLRRGVAETQLGLSADTPAMTPVAGLVDSKGVPVYGHTFAMVGFAGVAVSNLPVLIQTNRMVRDPDEVEASLDSRAGTAANIPDLVIGMDVLKQLHVYIAFAEKKMYITPAGSGESVLFKAAAK